MKVLVTGGAGFIGSHLVDKLINEGYKVAVIDDLSNGNLDFINKKAQFVEADIISQNFFQVFTKLNPKIVFHLAAQSSINKSLKNPSLDIEVNLIATQKLLDLSKSTNVDKFIFASSSAVYKPADLLPLKEDAPKEPISLYGVSKLCSEYLIRNFYKLYNLPCFSLRLANVYGPRQDSGAEGGVVAIFLHNVLSEKISKIHGNGKQTRDFIYVSDVIGAFMKSLEKEVVGEFNIGTAKETSINDLIEILSRIANSKIDRAYTSLPYPEVQRSALAYDKFRQSTGWNPKVNLEEGLSITYDYFKNL
ncbi:MAG: Nucleoside-diphosphate-sugar epimerase [Parcubacteria group bacterium GW2011_GWA1_36_12]|nr:MAG: Nucleoside-diphosphate-sugar epimerase [Parcubacteria group bacterium GW2011_GWA1_36_12]